MRLIRKSLPFATLAIATCLAIHQTRAVAQSTESETPYPTTEIPCPVPLAEVGEVEGETYTCGVLTVPENYDEPDGRQIEISYVVLNSHSLSPLPDPVFVLHGGPGGSNLSQLAPRRGWFDAQRQLRDVVLFDQRGTKFSSQIGCAPTMFALEAFNDEERERLEQYIASTTADDNPLTSDETVAQYALCAALLELHGVDLSQYNTPNNSQDTINLATALGYDQINLYGISYGTYLSMQTMRFHPERLRSVVLDSTAPPHVNKYDEVTLRSETPIRNVLADCEADAACNDAYPDLTARLNALLEQLDETPIPLSTTVTDPLKTGDDAERTLITLEQFVDDVTTRLNLAPAFAAYLPLIISELEQGITTTYEQTLSLALLIPAGETLEPGLTSFYLNRARTLEVEVQKLLEVEAELAQSGRPSTLWFERVRSHIGDLPEDEQTRALANFFGVGYQAGLPRDRTTLELFLAETFDDTTGETLSANLQTMSEAEIRHIYELLSDAIAAVSPVDAGSTLGMYMSFDCREHVAFSTQANLDAVYNRMELPLVGRSMYESIQEIYAECGVWPVEPADPIERQVVESDIPSLVLQGRYDTQTSTDRGMQAMVGLTNGTYVEFPSLGHGVVKTECAQAIGVAFVNSPDGEIDTSCTADLEVEFVLPPES